MKKILILLIIVCVGVWASEYIKYGDKRYYIHKPNDYYNTSDHKSLLYDLRQAADWEVQNYKNKVGESNDSFALIMYIKNAKERMRIYNKVSDILGVRYNNTYQYKVEEENVLMSEKRLAEMKQAYDLKPTTEKRADTLWNRCKIENRIITKSGVGVKIPVYNLQQWQNKDTVEIKYISNIKDFANLIEKEDTQDRAIYSYWVLFYIKHHNFNIKNIQLLEETHAKLKEWCGMYYRLP